MIALEIHHRTTYRYRRLVSLGPHRLMLRPRESRDLRLISSAVTVAPAAQVTWAHDVLGNAVATAMFHGATDSLIVDSVVQLELAGSAWPIFDIAASAIVYPFRYSDDEWTDLGALTIQQYPDPTGRVAKWARAFVGGERTDTLALLKDLSLGVSAWISYQSREDEGTQSPIETLDRGWGSCRDFAVLFVEAARSLGFGARIVSGYLFDPDRSVRIDRRRLDPRLGRSLRPRRRLDQLRSDQPQRRRRQPHPCRRRARHPPSDAGLRQLRRRQRRVHRHDGGSRGDLGRAARLKIAPIGRRRPLSASRQLRLGGGASLGRRATLLRFVGRNREE